MRADMHKVIVERPRYGSRVRNNKTGLKIASGAVGDSWDDFDGGSRRPAPAERDKQFNEHLGPLRKFLRRQVGRPWNKVYAEIRERIDTRSVIGFHVLQHVDWEVEQQVVMDGRVPSRESWRGLVPVRGLYVHPVTGLLRYAERRPRPVEVEEKNLVPLSETEEFRKIDGLWYWLEFAYNAANERVLMAKRQCGRKTVRRIEAGELGPLVNQARYYRWPRKIA